MLMPYPERCTSLGFVENRLLKQAEGIVSRYLVEGEEVIARELLLADQNNKLLPPFFMGKARRVDAILTTRRIILCSGSKGILAHIPLTAIGYFASEVNGYLEITVTGGLPWGFTVPADRRAFAEAIKGRLLRLQKMDFEYDLTGRRLRATYFPWRRDRMACWRWSLDVQPISKQDLNELGQALLALGDKIAANPLSGPAPEGADKTQFDERDWRDEIFALLGYSGEAEDKFSWVAGHELDGSGWGLPSVWVLTERKVFSCKFETGREAFLPKAPSAVGVPVSTIADWQVRKPEPDGAIMVRLLILSDQQRQCSRLEEALHDRPSDHKLWLLGLPATSHQGEFVEGLVIAVQTFGAFEPGARAYHPLQEKG